MYYVAGILIVAQLEDSLQKILISNTAVRLQNSLSYYTSPVIDTVENSKRYLNYFSEWGSHRPEFLEVCKPLLYDSLKYKGYKVAES